MRILIIEDDADLLRIIEQSLKKEGLSVMAAENGKDGLLLALHQEIDLIIMDLMLPEMDGWEILKNLRQKKSVPVLILTARDTVEDRVRGLDEGSDDFLVKPFHLEELRARVHALLRRSCLSMQQSVTIAEGVVYDARKQCVTRGSESLDLTGKELQLLQLLVGASGGIVSRDRIYDRVFGDLDESENVIEVYIYKLRKKLGRQSIKTVRGLGYKLAEVSA